MINNTKGRDLPVSVLPFNNTSTWSSEVSNWPWSSEVSNWPWSSEVSNWPWSSEVSNWPRVRLSSATIVSEQLTERVTSGYITKWHL